MVRSIVLCFRLPATVMATARQNVFLTCLTIRHATVRGRHAAQVGHRRQYYVLLCVMCWHLASCRNGGVAMCHVVRMREELLRRRSCCLWLIELKWGRICATRAWLRERRASLLRGCFQKPYVHTYISLNTRLARAVGVTWVFRRTKIEIYAAKRERKRGRMRKLAYNMLI